MLRITKVLHYIVFSRYIRNRVLRIPYLVLLEFYRGFIANKKSYSQFGEDILLEELLKYKKNGSYIEIGSGRPVTRSNSWKLYRKGWTGVCVDPIADNMLLHKLLRKRDLFVCALVSEVPSKVTFYETWPYEYSSTDYNRILELQNKSKLEITNKSELNTCTINSLLECNPEPDLLLIDAEGMDYQIVKAFLGKVICLPIIVCIENHAFESSNDKIHNLLVKNNYILKYNQNPSFIYIQN